MGQGVDDPSYDTGENPGRDLGEVRGRVLRTPCAFCGQASGFWCVDAGGRKIRNIYRQHDRRYQKAATTPAELRVLLTKQRLI